MARQPQWRTLEYPAPAAVELASVTRRHLVGVILGAGVDLSAGQAELVADVILADEQHRPDPADYPTLADGHRADCHWRTGRILAGLHDPGPAVA